MTTHQGKLDKKNINGINVHNTRKSIYTINMVKSDVKIWLEIVMVALTMFR